MAWVPRKPALPRTALSWGALGLGIKPCLLFLLLCFIPGLVQAPALHESTT